MHLAFDIFQGIGVAAAVGIRPFLPTLAVGGLAAGDVEIHFNGTHYAFLQGAPFLIAIAAAAIVLALIEWRLPPSPPSAGSTSRWSLGPLAIVLGIASLALGALLFAGSLADGHHAAWPGLIAGALVAAVGVLATVPLLRRVRARLDQGALAALPVFVEGVAVLFAVLSVLAPPVGLLVLALLVWLLYSGRRREEQKYAGLRILR